MKNIKESKVKYNGVRKNKSIAIYSYFTIKNIIYFSSVHIWA